MTNQRSSTRRRFSFSLRMLLVLTVVCAYLAYWYAQHRHAAYAWWYLEQVRSAWDADAEAAETVLIASQRAFDAQCSVPFADASDVALELLKRHKRFQTIYSVRMVCGPPPEYHRRKRNDMDSFVADAYQRYLAV